MAIIPELAEVFVPDTLYDSALASDLKSQRPVTPSTSHPFRLQDHEQSVPEYQLPRITMISND